MGSRCAISRRRLLLLLIAGRSLRDLRAGRAAALFFPVDLGRWASAACRSMHCAGLMSRPWASFSTHSPAWVAVISALRRVERLDVRKATALGLALAGIVIIIGGPRQMALPSLGVALALGSAFIYAVYIPLVHWLRGPLSAATASSLVTAGAGLAFTVVAPRWASCE